ncbi:OmpA/MotB domain protein [Sulfitobacter noctilucae]|uniref:type IVB secretion system protein IcmH/DotU n=1 Tax=Sulfitobacter noctilucae TaxID=1342302 RepID=UPI000469E724|nr:type IVB secretion system protein IcmH/DotU [Sulfitobacter noctilucae]KIN75144.1 OmpA/MotB domain protein [Sulfitobacter noctilucae]
MSDDDDKTVFGQPLPPAGGGKSGGQGTASDKTVFGQPLPPAGGSPQGGGRAGPGQRPLNNPGADDTWFGGNFDPQPRPVAQPYPPQQPPAQQPLYQPGTGQRAAGAEIFPEIQRPQDAPQYAQRPRIAFQDALRGAAPGTGGSSNPILRAASNLLILLGRLRTGLVDMQPAPLIDHVTREIDNFERTALSAGVTAQDASDAKYALSATADDIVQNLPGADRGTWLEYSMVARFFGERSSGVGFFQKMDEAMRAPGQRFHLLELMLTCLSLGFEGQYRAMPNGGVELSRIRTAIYETLRRVQPRPDDDVSVRWTPVLLGGKRRRGGVPLWVIAAVAAVMVVSLFATLSTLLTREGAEVRSRILAVHAGQPPVTIERTEPIIRGYEAPTSTQLERIRTALAPEIENGEVEVDRNTDWVFVRVGDVLQFGSGSATLTNDFSTLAASIGRTFDDEPGPVRVVGHTDSIPPSGRGQFKTNEDLSVARAQTVADIVQGVLIDPSRVVVEGKGAVDPIADNGTREGRARNRRVEIMIPRTE